MKTELDEEYGSWGDGHAVLIRPFNVRQYEVRGQWHKGEGSVEIDGKCFSVEEAERIQLAIGRALQVARPGGAKRSGREGA